MKIEINLNFFALAFRETCLRQILLDKEAHPTTNSKLAKYKGIQGYSENKSC